jgi:hypothetical protein
MKADELRQPGNERKLLRIIRTVAKASFFDDRTEDEFRSALREILILMKGVGNEPLEEYEWDHFQPIQ